MYRREFRRGAFHHFGWLPVVLGALFLIMLFSGGFHRVWFFVGPLCLGVPFFIAGGIAALAAMRWRTYGSHHNPRHGDFFGDFFRGEKIKHGEHDSDSETFYV